MFHEISYYQLNVYGIKCESPSTIIQIKQTSANDRKPHDYQPLKLNELAAFEANRLTVKRLHFAVTTENNRKVNNKPNPNQRYFKLVVELQVITMNGGSFILYAVESDEIIVRVNV